MGRRLGAAGRFSRPKQRVVGSRQSVPIARLAHRCFLENVGSRYHRVIQIAWATTQRAIAIVAAIAVAAASVAHQAATGNAQQCER